MCHRWSFHPIRSFADEVEIFLLILCKHIACGALHQRFWKSLPEECHLAFCHPVNVESCSIFGWFMVSNWSSRRGSQTSHQPCWASLSQQKCTYLFTTDRIMCIFYLLYICCDKEVQEGWWDPGCLNILQFDWSWLWMEEDSSLLLPVGFVIPSLMVLLAL